VPYVPSFTEVFFGYLAILFWSAWLGRKGQAPGWMHFGPIGIGLALLGAQVVATRAVMTAEAGTLDGSSVEAARWASLGLVAFGAAVNAGFTARHFAGRAPPSEPPVAR
jgi:hypothetical protein